MAASPLASSPALEDDPAARTERLEAATARELLQSGECPVCRFANRSESRFFLWFALEHYQERGTIERVDAALGFCPRHCRTLIRSNLYSGTMTDVYLHVARAALARLGEQRPQGPCIGCEHGRWAAGYAVNVVVRSLSRPEVVSAYENGGGFCARHFLEALRTRSLEQLRTPLEALEARLSAAEPDPASIAVLTGTDPDAGARVLLLEALPQDEIDSPAAQRMTTLDRLAAALRAGSCPVCLSSGRAERRYLRFVGDEREKDRSGFGREVVGLCPEHLATFALFDAGSATWPAGEQAALWRGVLSRFREKVREIPTPALAERFRTLRAAGRRLIRGPGTRSGRIEAFFELASHALSPRRHWRRRVEAFGRELPGCGACRAHAVAERRTAALLTAAMEDRSFAPLYQSAHGLCVRHVLALPAEGRAAPLETCRARLRLIQWELEEADRKLDWFVRYEPRASESSAWIRAMARIDGRVFLGGEPVASLP